MNQHALNQLTKNRDPACRDLVTMAERELAAFLRAVTELFGLEQAELSAQDWLHELALHELAIPESASNDLPVSTGQWRRLTVKALARLASRVNASPASIASPTLAYSD